MKYEEAQQKALTIKWKTTPCHQGEECWCRIIEPTEPILYDDNEEYYIVGSGSIPKLEEMKEQFYIGEGITTDKEVIYIYSHY